MINNNLILNVYEKKTLKSKISTQLLYGEKFSIIRKYKDCLKIKSSYDKYIGYISKKKYLTKINPTHKVSVLKADLYSKPNKKFKLKEVEHQKGDVKNTLASIDQIKEDFGFSITSNFEEGIKQFANWYKNYFK